MSMQPIVEKLEGIRKELNDIGVFLLIIAILMTANCIWKINREDSTKESKPPVIQEEKEAPDA